ncbi:MULTISPECIES: DUF6679 family protein [unclassified Synechococcus]|uniref:DUF6679 family protein n=1 Tax=unclassified Synechococcus TaxID=2626047 RepID=UPI0008FF7177|nr:MULTISPECIES: DUF6679 family protein [unclassified Synechococcus]APD48234.1 hypothetical protein BM449_08265 [Synechococcus sp. SynAce01]MCT0246710.1 hypothetical protein [Synechococcus sp. CS-601]MCT4363518.1 hypothetical protein [Candidatus Regnicoccus frigidus MAG-AL1]TWB93928.1 hypothetical protein FB106_103209 [Synechococcus sp. Ace-Pa]
MLVRKLDQFRKEKRPIWVFLRDQQRWIEQALVVEIEGDLVTFRYDAEEDDESHSWEESVRLRSIGAVSTRLAFFNRSTQADELATADDCPESEQLRH